MPEESSDSVQPPSVVGDGEDVSVNAAQEFERLAAESDAGFLQEFWQFLKEEKRWWLTPIIIACLSITGLAWFTSTGAYPFIYSLF